MKVEKDTVASLVSPLAEDELMKAFYYMEIFRATSVSENRT